MKKVILSLLSIVLTISLLTGCGMSAIVENSKLSGTWKATLDFSKFMDENLKNSDESLQYIKITNCDVKVDFTFTPAGTYVVVFDTKSFEDTCDSLKKDFKKGIIKYMEKVIKDEGVDLTVDDYLEYLGKTMDELVEMALNEDQMMANLKASVSAGKYILKGDKLYISIDPVKDPDMDKYLTIEFEGDNKLTLSKGKGKTSYDQYLPFSMEKQD